jgi:hypothetical protein
VAHDHLSASSVCHKQPFAYADNNRSSQLMSCFEQIGIFADIGKDKLVFKVRETPSNLNARAEYLFTQLEADGIIYSCGKIYCITIYSNCHQLQLSDVTGAYSRSSTTMSTSVFSVLPTTLHCRCLTTFCTPTKHAKLIVLHENCHLSFDDIAACSPFKHTSLHPTTLSRNYCQVKEHGGNCYWNGKKGRGAKKKIPEAALENAIEKLDQEKMFGVSCFLMFLEGWCVMLGFCSHTPC